MTDIIQTFPNSFYSGSYTDLGSYGNSLISTVSSSRQALFSKVSGINQNVFKNKNILFSERLSMYSGSARGSKSQNLFLQAFDTTEQYYDSFAPSPYSIIQANGTPFVYLNNSGSLSGSTRYGIPSDITTQTVPILLGKKLSRSLDLETVDTDWLNSPYPFQSKYKNLRKVFQPSYFLPEPLVMTKNYWNSGTVSVTSSQIGSIYFFGTTKVRVNHPMFYIGTQASASIGFRLAGVPNAKNTANSEIERLRCYFDPSSSITYYVGTSQTSFFTSKNGMDWVSSYPTSLDYPGSALAYDNLDSSYLYVNGTKTFFCWGIMANTGVTQNAYVLTNSSPDANKNTWSGPIDINFTGSILGAKYLPRGTTGSWCVLYRSGVYNGNASVAWSTGSNPHLPLSFTSQTDAISGGYIVDYGVDWIPFNQRVIAVGTWRSGSTYKGGIWRSRNNLGSGSWDLISNITGTLSSSLNASDDVQLYSVAADPAGGQTIIAVGANGQIVRSANAGTSWTVVSAASSYTGSFYSVSKGKATGTIGPNWFTCGDSGEIQTSNDDGLTWSRVQYTNRTTVAARQAYFYSTLYSTHETVSSGVYIARENPNYLVGGRSLSLPSTAGKVFLRYRVCDAEVSTTQSNNSNENYASSIIRESFNNAFFANESNFSYTKANIKDFNKVFYGFGNGFNLQLDDVFYDYNQVEIQGRPTDPGLDLRKNAPEFLNYSFIRNDTPTGLQSTDELIFPGNPVESIRLYGPILRGFRYGLINANPTNLKTVFRRDRFGQFRDMLEQKPYTKIFLPPGNENVNSNVLSAPISVVFVTGSTAYARAQIYASASAPTDFNPTDSGIYDYECKSGQPFFDDREGVTY